MNWVEITLAVIGGGNFVMQLMIKNEILKVKLDITERFITKKDFSSWASRSNYLPDFKDSK